MKYQVYELDLLIYDDEGSWTVNDVFKTDYYITIDDDTNHSEIYKQLENLGYNCDSNSSEVFEIMWHEDFLEITNKGTGRIELQLWAVKKEVVS